MNFNKQSHIPTNIEPRYQEEKLKPVFSYKDLRGAVENKQNPREKSLIRRSELFSHK